MFKINIVDVANIVHIGNYRFANAKVTDINNKDIPTGGIFALTNLLRRREVNPRSDVWIFCFDKRSFRKDIDPNYKSGREKISPKLIMQLRELEHWLKKMGYNVMSVEGFEADDLIASLVKDHRNPEKYYFNIFTTDRDSGFLVGPDCRLLSSAGNVSNLTMSNFATNFNSKHYVYYNTAFLYKVIVGDSSDGIEPIQKNAYSLYKRICQNLIDKGFDLSTLNEFKTLEKILEILPNKEKAKHNWSLIKPAILGHLTLQPQELNNEVIGEFCALFGLNLFAKKMGVHPLNYTSETTKQRLALTEFLTQRSTGSSEQKEVMKPNKEEDEEDPVEEYFRLKEIRNLKIDGLQVNEV